MSVYTGLGIAQGAAQVGKYAREKPERDLRMQDAKNRQELSNMKLNEYKADSPMRQSAKDVEIQSLKNELYKGQSAGLQARTFSAFDKFQGDRNVRHLNNFLPDAKANPIGAKMFQNITRYDSTDSPAGQKLLKQAGIDADAESTSQFVLVTQADGTQVLADMNQVFASTGYTKHMDDQALDRLTKESLNTQRLRSGMSSGRITDTQRLAEIIMSENKDMTKQEAWEEASGILKPKSTGRGSELERLAEDLMANDPELSKVDAYAEAVRMKKEGGTAQERLAKNREKGASSPEAETLHTESTRSTDQVKIDEVNTAKDSLDEMFEGSFTDSDMTVPANRIKASRLMSRVEQEFPMSVADRKVAKEIRQLTALGNVAGAEITDQQAGPIDSMIRGIKKYISNDVEGVEGTAAYEAFRNTLRHSLYGATVSKGETQTFTSAMGSLAEQKGPVLVKLKTQMNDLREQLSSVYDMNDPYVAKYRLNMDQDQLADVIAAIDERIDMMDGMLKADAPNIIVPTVPVSPLRERYNKFKVTNNES